MLLSLLTTLTSLLSLVSAHGKLLQPPQRSFGPNLLRICGQEQYDFLSGANHGNDLIGWQRKYDSGRRPLPGDWWVFSSCIWGLEGADAKGGGSNWNLCRGYQYEDHIGHHVWPPGHQVYFEYYIAAPHPGRANYSIVHTSTNTILHTLHSWNGQLLHSEGKLAFAEKTTAQGAPDSQTKVWLEIPDLGGRCTSKGECVVQFWWWGDLSAQRDQIYESCVDFVQPVGAGEEEVKVTGPSKYLLPTRTGAAVPQETMQEVDCHRGEGMDEEDVVPQPTPGQVVFRTEENVGGRGGQEQDVLNEMESGMLDSANLFRVAGRFAAGEIEIES